MGAKNLRFLKLGQQGVFLINEVWSRETHRRVRGQKGPFGIEI